MLISNFLEEVKGLLMTFYRLLNQPQSVVNCSYIPEVNGFTSSMPDFSVDRKSLLIVASCFLSMTESFVGIA